MNLSLIFLPIQLLKYQRNNFFTNKMPTKIH